MKSQYTPIWLIWCTALLGFTCEAQPVAPPVVDMDLEPAGALAHRFVTQTPWHARPVVDADSLQQLLSPSGKLLWVDNQAVRSGSACTVDAPCATIGAALDRARPGDAVVVRAGIYREAVQLRRGGSPGLPLTLAAFPGDMVVVNGADPLTDKWIADGTGWERRWDVSLPMHRSRQRPQDAFRPEILFVDGLPMRQVFLREHLTPGSFWIDGEPEAPRRLYARFRTTARPDSLHLEAGVRPMLLTGADSTVTDVHIRGMIFMGAPNSGKNGCFQSVGRRWEVEENLVAWCNGLGIMVAGSEQTFRGNWAVHNGQMGWSSRTSHSLLEDNQSVGNNWKGYDARWEAGGGKFVETTHTTIRRHYAAYNNGPGIWLDIDNDHMVVEESHVVGNQKAGIMLEFRTTGTTVRNNVVYATRLLEGTGSGIQIQAANNNRIEYNTVYSNEGDGIRYKHGDGRARSGGTYFVGNLVLNNGLGPTRAQEMRVEGVPPADNPDTYIGNIYGRRGNEDAVFFVAEMPSNDLDTWLRFSGAEADRIQAHPRRALVDVRSPSGWQASGTEELTGAGVQVQAVGPR